MELTNPTAPGSWTETSLRQLKPLETVELVLDAALVVLARGPRRALADPAPFLHQQFLVLAVGLEVDGGDDVFADQNRQREIAEHAFFLRHIGLEAVTVVEEQFGALALDDQGIERREDVHRAIARFSWRVCLQHFRPDPMLLLAGAFERDRHQFLAPHIRPATAASPCGCPPASRKQTIGGPRAGAPASPGRRSENPSPAHRTARASSTRTRFCRRSGPGAGRRGHRPGCGYRECGDGSA